MNASLEMTTKKPLMNSSAIQGVLLINKPVGRTSFSLVGSLRKILGVKKIGHAGTLDPFATGVMVMLIGREYTKLSDQFLCDDKEYTAKLRLGISTDSHDCEGQVTRESSQTPTLEEIEKALLHFQGEIDQIPPMFSAKKVNGKKLYELARKGKTIERKPVKVKLSTHLIHFAYPYLDIQVKCSKGTYIRTIADDLGNMLGCGAHLVALNRIRCGQFALENCVDGNLLNTIEKTTLLPHIEQKQHASHSKS